MLKYSELETIICSCFFYNMKTRMSKYNKPAVCVIDDGLQTLAFVKVEG